MKFINFVLIVSCIFLANTSNILAAVKAESRDLKSSDENIKLNKALYLAAHSGNYEEVKNLLEQGADVNYHTPNIGIAQADGLTPLHWAVGLGDEAKLDLNKPTDKSLVEKRLKVVKLLISKGANVNAKSFLGNTPLHMAKTKEVVELLIKHGADVNAQSNIGHTPLMTLTAVYNRNWVNQSVSEVLIKYGADINHKSKGEENALVLAVRTYNQEQVKLLVENGADINFSEKGKNSALENAILNAMNGKGSKMAGYLITKGAFLLSTGTSLGFSELHLVVNQNNLPLVKTVLAYGTAIDYPDKYGNTALLLAVINNNKEIVKFLINSGADVNVTNRKLDDRPLFFFAKDEKMMNLLLKSGVDVSVVDNLGKSYLHYIKDEKLLSLIEKAGRS